MGPKRYQWVIHVVGVPMAPSDLRNTEQKKPGRQRSVWMSGRAGGLVFGAAYYGTTVHTITMWLGKGGREEDHSALTPPNYPLAVIYSISYIETSINREE